MKMMEFETIALTEISHMEKVKYHMVSFNESPKIHIYTCVK